MWHQECQRIADAIAVERQNKGWSRAKKVALIRGDFDSIRRLASRAKVRRSLETTTASRRPSQDKAVFRILTPRSDAKHRVSKDALSRRGPMARPSRRLAASRQASSRRGQDSALPPRKRGRGRAEGAGRGRCDHPCRQARAGQGGPSGTSVHVRAAIAAPRPRKISLTEIGINARIPSPCDSHERARKLAEGGKR